MAQSLANLATVLNKNLDLVGGLADLIARSNPTLAGITKRGVASQELYLKAKTSTNHNPGAIADGTLLTPASSAGNTATFIQPTLSWSTYKSEFAIPKRLISQTAGQPAELGRLVMMEITDAAKDLGDLIASHMWGGSVTNGLVGIQTALDDDNTYATIDRTVAANAPWRTVTVDAKTGTAPSEVGTEISTETLYRFEEAFYNRQFYSWRDRPGTFYGITTPAFITKYSQLFETIDLASLATSHFVNQANASGFLGKTTVGFMGVPFGRDRNIGAAAGDLANTARLYMLDPSHIFLAVLDPMGESLTHTVAGASSAPVVDGIRCEIELLGNKGEVLEGYLKTYIQLCVPDPARHAVLKNILIN